MHVNYNLTQDKILKNIRKNLINLDPDLTLQYLSWLEKKTMYFRQSVLKVSYGSQPDDIKRGDVVWAEFGVNVGNELSDVFTKGHYALVWAVDLGNVVVIPLTSRNSYNSMLCLDLGIIEGLNELDTSHSYLKLDAIRSISKRRIGRMPSKPQGKLSLSEEQLNKVKNHIYNYFVKEDVSNYSSELEILNYIAYHIDNN